MYSYISFHLLAPGVVMVVVDTNRTTITWNPPQIPNGVIINYRVIIFIYDRPTVVTNDSLGDNSTTYNFSSLSKHNCVLVINVVVVKYRVDY